MTTLNILPALGGSDLPDEARLEYGHLSNKLSTYQASNAIKAQFYDMENQWRDLGIAVPPAVQGHRDRVRLGNQGR